MKILLTNDDGVEADGIRALRMALMEDFDVVVLAPDQQRSECSHSVTGKEPLKLQQLANDLYSLSGTPVDCVRLGLAELVPTADLVVAGINHGANLGGDIWVSGTVAAAREARLRGKPAIAISQYRRPEIHCNWATASQFAVEIIDSLIPKLESRTTAWNVNLPATEGQVMPELSVCDIDPNPLPVKYTLSDEGYQLTGCYHDRPRERGTDVDLCFGGQITASEIRVC